MVSVDKLVESAATAMYSSKHGRRSFLTIAGKAGAAVGLAMAGTVVRTSEVEAACGACVHDAPCYTTCGTCGASAGCSGGSCGPTCTGWQGGCSCGLEQSWLWCFEEIGIGIYCEDCECNCTGTCSCLCEAGPFNC